MSGSAAPLRNPRHVWPPQPDPVEWRWDYAPLSHPAAWTCENCGRDLKGGRFVNARYAGTARRTWWCADCAALYVPSAPAAAEKP